MIFLVGIFTKWFLHGLIIVTSTPRFKFLL